MKVAVLGGGPAGLYFAISMKLRNSAHEVTVVERNKPDDTFGWGVVLSAETLDNLTRNDPGQRRLDQALLRLLGRHRGRLQGRAHALDRPRLLRHRPQAAADAPAAPRARTRHQASSSRPRCRTPAPTWRRTTSSSPRTASTRARARPSPRCSSPTSTRANASSCGSARTRNSTTPSPSSSRRPSTAGCGRTPTSSTRTPRPSSSSAARRPGRNSASAA